MELGLKALGLALILGGAGRFLLVWVSAASRCALKWKLYPAPRRHARLLRRLVYSLCGASAALSVFRPFGSVVVLFGLILLPLLVASMRYYNSRFLGAQLDDSALVYFHALRGLVHSGLGLPAALFQLSKSQPTLFSQAMAKTLAGFDQGKALNDCLKQLSDRNPSPLVKGALQGLQMAYAQGVAILPVLERVVPLLEQDQRRRRRMADLRRSTMVQAGFALSVPWILNGALYLVQPELVARQWAESGAFTLVIAVFAVQAMGLWSLFQVSRFC